MGVISGLENIFTRQTITPKMSTTPFQRSQFFDALSSNSNYGNFYFTMDFLILFWNKIRGINSHNIIRLAT